MIFYTTMTKNGDKYAYIYKSKKELLSVIGDGILKREGYTEIQNNKTEAKIKTVRQHFIDNNIKYAETYKSDDYCYKDYDFCLPVIGQEYLFKPMLY